MGSATTTLLLAIGARTNQTFDRAACGARCWRLRNPSDRLGAREGRRVGVLHIAKLLRLDEIVMVRVPSEAQEVARHRVTDPAEQASTRTHHDWLRQQRFEVPGLHAAFDAAHEAFYAQKQREGRAVDPGAHGGRSGAHATALTTAEPTWPAACATMISTADTAASANIPIDRRNWGTHGLMAIHI